MVLEITDANFEKEVLNSSIPVLVDFWAEWCGPCKMIAPTLEDLSKELNNVKIVKVNIEDSPEIPQKYGVRGIPTLMIFKNGEVEATKVGAISKQVLKEWVTDVL